MTRKADIQPQHLRSKSPAHAPARDRVCLGTERATEPHLLLTYELQGVFVINVCH